MTLDMQLTSPANINQAGKKRQLRDGLQITSLIGEAAWQSDMQHCFISS